MSGPVKVFVSLPDKIKNILTVFAFLAAVSKVYSSYFAKMHATYNPAAIIAFYLRNGTFFSRGDMYEKGLSAAAAAVLAFVLWFVLEKAPDKLHLNFVLCLISDAIMVSIYFGIGGTVTGTFTGKAVYAVLFILSADHLRAALGHNKKRYPFAFFIAVLAFLLIIPSRKDPINWKPVVNAAKRMAERTREAAHSVSYYLEDLKVGSSYQTGYSSLAQTGDSIFYSDRTELLLKTIDNTTFNYFDEESGKEMRRRRAVYLTGGREADSSQLFDILFSLYAHDVDTAQASLFFRRTRLDVTYVYLRTKDEILPEGVIKVTDGRGLKVEGNALKNHRKGYGYRAEYLDFDYGSPYLINILESPMDLPEKGSISFKTLSMYSYNTYGINLSEYADEEEYKKWQETAGPEGGYLDTAGASGRMKELAAKITAGCENDYDKCRAVETYLRQYAYSTDTGTGTAGDTGSTEGMSKLSDSFLFETGKGYCVHYATAMVMLLRLNGIPARYTNGYRYLFPFDRQDSYEVSSACAHAWPEAYIKGFGWVSFEPTSLYLTASERSWNRKPADDPAGAAVPVSANNIKAPYPAPAVTVSDAGEGIDTPDKDDLKEKLRIAVIITVSVVLAAVLMIAGAIAVRIIRYRRADHDGRLIMDVSDMTALIRAMSQMPLADRGLLSDYEPYLPEKYLKEIKEVFDIYYRIRYSCHGDGKGSETVTLNEGQKARELRNALYREYRGNKGGNIWILSLLSR